MGGGELRGREAELAEIRAWVGAPERGRLFYVQGPGGIGKSALLRAVHHELLGAGRAVVRIDLRTLPPTAAAVDAALDRALKQRGEGAPEVLLLDSFDAHARLEPRYRERLAAEPGAPLRWVVAGRRALQRAWLHGPGAIAGLTVHRLGSLPLAASRALLQGVPDALADLLLELSLGHPGALLEAARLSRAGVQQPAALIDRVYAAVVEASDPAPSAAHFEALCTCALLPSLDSRLLAAALDTPEAARLHAWLSGHSAMQLGSGRVGLDPLFAQALRREYRLSHPEPYARRVLQLGRLLAERLARANRTEVRQAAVEGLLRLGRSSAELPLPSVQVEPVSPEAMREVLARERPDLVASLELRGRVQCQLVRRQEVLLGCLLLLDPRARSWRTHRQGRALRALLAARAVSAAERVVLVEPVPFRDDAGRIGAARAVFGAVARLLHADRTLSVGVVAGALDDQRLPAFSDQLGMLTNVATVVPEAAEDGSSLWFCDHARRGPAACLYGQLLERYVPRGQPVVA